MAMATQQHYLVEIDKKLSGIAKGIDEVLARDAITTDERSIVDVMRSAASSALELP